MKSVLTQWVRRYQTALGKHLEQDPGPSLKSGHKLGIQAVALELETLDVAQVHAQALVSLGLGLSGGSSKTRETMIERAKGFFSEVIVPIEKTHLAAMKAADDVHQLNLKLLQRTKDSAASTRKLERVVAQLQAAIVALKKRREENSAMIQESRRLQNSLRKQARKMLLEQEKERQSTSLRLQEEIAQPLAAIHLRLLTLKNPVRSDLGNLAKDIAKTQQMVQRFKKTIHGLTKEKGDLP